MSRASVVGLCRAFFAGVVLVAIATQLISFANQGTLNAPRSAGSTPLCTN